MRRTTKRNDNRNRRNISKNDRYDLLTVRKRGELPVGGGAGSPATHSKHRAWLIIGIILAAVLVLGIGYLAGRSGEGVVGKAQFGGDVGGVGKKAKESQQAVSAPCSSPSAGLIAWWKGELQNKVAIDTAGSIHDGAVGMENPALSVSGKVGSALDISPQNGNYLGVAHSSDLALTTQLTIEGWIKPRTQKNAQLVRKWVDNKGYNLVMTSAGKIKLYINNRVIESTAIIPTGEFTHIAVVYNGPGELLRTFINGQAGPGATIIPASITANTESLYIGGGVTGQVFDGLIDELSIYNRALSAIEIQSIRDAYSAGKCREICSTSGDDDGDGLVNCADPDCAGQAADQAGHLCETPESSCSDSFDNDGDTYMDFMDLTNCNKGQSCTKGDGSPGTIVWSYFLPAQQSQYAAGTPPSITQIGCCGATQCVTESGVPSNPVLCFNKDQLTADPAFVCGDNNNIVQCNAAAQGTVTSTSTNKNLCDNNQWKTCDASRNNVVIGNKKCLAGAWGLFTQQCGNYVKEGTEACDGTALAGQTCVTQMGAGFTGTLTCKADCSGFVTTGCVAPLEICGDGLDNDNDAQIDAADANCARGNACTQADSSAGVVVWSYLATDNQNVLPSTDRIKCCPAATDCVFGAICRPLDYLHTPSTPMFNCGINSVWDKCGATTDSAADKHNGDISDSEKQYCDGVNWKTCGVAPDIDGTQRGDYRCQNNKWVLAPPCTSQNPTACTTQTDCNNAGLKWMYSGGCVSNCVDPLVDIAGVCRLKTGVGCSSDNDCVSNNCGGGTCLAAVAAVVGDVGGDQGQQPDGCVTDIDYAYLEENYDPACVPDGQQGIIGDVNNDGCVNDLDYAYLEENYDPTCTPTT